MNIYDIAELAGVSIATVSRVVNGSPRVSEQTRQKVLSVMEENDYTPNVFARGLGLDSMQIIGIICPDVADAYMARAVSFLERRLKEYGYDCILYCSGHEQQKKEEEENAERLVEGFDIRCPGIMTAAGSLSGGNIQKVILARELDRKPSFLVAVYPTRGLDMGAVEFIHQRLLEIRESGIGILLISEELEEIMNLSDRIAVIYKGTVQKVLRQDEATKERLGILMAGVKE